MTFDPNFLSHCPICQSPTYLHVYKSYRCCPDENHIYSCNNHISFSMPDFRLYVYDKTIAMNKYLYSLWYRPNTPLATLLFDLTYLPIFSQEDLSTYLSSIQQSYLFL